uniref:Uncharacterized protein n=1 Tax=Anguilla anguilla TaxID=7936 RepID=A0A0E9QZP2_ANGAN
MVQTERGGISVISPAFFGSRWSLSVR